MAKQPELTPRQGAFLTGFALFGAIFVVYVGSLAAAQPNSDSFANSFASWHYAHTGSPFFDGSRLPEMDGGPDYFGPNPDGHTVIGRTPGQIWAAAPFYLLLSGGDFADFDTGPGMIAAAFWSALAMLLFFVAVRSRMAAIPAAGATALLAFGTPVWSVAAEGLWPHVVTVLAIAGTSWAASREKWGWAGVMLGVGILARPHVAVIAAILGLGVTYSRRSLRPAVLVAIGSGLLTAVLLLWNRFVFGAWSLAGGYSQGFVDAIPGQRESRLGDGYLVQVAGAMLSPNRGFLVWTPSVILLLPAVCRFRARLPVWSLWLALGGIGYAVVQTALNEWTGGSGFNSYRLMLELLMCLAPSCAMASAYLGPVAQRLAPYVVGYQVAVISVAALLDDALLESDFWTDNTVLVGLRDQTLLTVLLLAGFGLCAWFATRWFLGRSKTVTTAASPEDGSSLSMLR